MTSKSIITSLVWIKKGYAKSIPIEYEEEITNIKKFKKVEKKLKEQAKLTGEETIKETTKKIEEELDNLDFNKIKLDEEIEELENVPTFCEEFKKYYKKGENKEENDEDYPEGFDDIDEEEQDDFTIHKTDSLIACATAQDDISNIEVYIFDEQSQSLFVHHDILLSTYPICLEWLPVNLKNTGNIKANYVVVGSFLPEIEIWNLDMLDVLEPDLILGESANDSDKYFKDLKKKKNKLKAGSKTSSDNLNCHTDAVLALNVNPFNNSILCSGSADSNILFWDLTSGKCFNSLREHKDKVQTVRWNKIEDNVIISGSYDKTIKLFDVRDNSSSTTIQISSDVENIEWSPLNKYLFLTSYENGKIDLYDIRKFDTVISFQAHKKAATGISFSNKKEGLFASVGLDSYVKVWDAENINSTESIDGSSHAASLVCEKFGELFVSKFAEDLDFTLAVGGSKGELFIWQLEENPNFCNRYGLKWEGEEKIEDKYKNISKKKVAANKKKSKY